ncbi:MAG: protein arginine kinase [Halanaerobiales bacterium]
MSIRDNVSHWIIGSGPKKDIVISSRIRLARNIEDIPFPGKAVKKQLNQVTDKVRNAVQKYKKDKLHYLDINDLPGVEKRLLVEKNLISPVHTEPGDGKGVLLNDRENVSIMVNEEDHLRMQFLLPGLQLEEAWETADDFDNILEDEVDFAFSRKWGYITACPTNLGTGMRASVMVHLPALDLTDNIGKMLNAVSKLGLVVRGIYGEGSKSSGNLYQISNQITLGASEVDIIENLQSVTSQIIDKEKETRKRLMEEKEMNVRDRINRAYGILKHAYTISSEEAMELISYTKLGVDLGIIDYIDASVLNQLVILTRPGHLQKDEGRKLQAKERDIKRAELIQKVL